MVFATAGWLIILGVLGMAPLPELPVNDKALHFFGVSLFGIYIDWLTSSSWASRLSSYTSSSKCQSKSRAAVS